jgi:hypothetical protein
MLLEFIFLPAILYCKWENFAVRKMNGKCLFMWRHAGKCAYRLPETFRPSPGGASGYLRPFGKKPKTIIEPVRNAYRVA